MTEHIDHATAALHLLASVDSERLETESFAVSAQVHATLALVEQMRIQNALAVAMIDQTTDLAENVGAERIRLRDYLSPEQWESIEYRQEGD